MINSAISLIVYQLNSYVRGLDDESVVMGNIAFIESDSNAASAPLENRVVVTLVNLEEESAFKNISSTTRSVNGGVQYTNPPVYLNLYLLFTANFPANYDLAVQSISDVIKFFQQKRVFRLKNSPSIEIPDTPDPEFSAIELYLNLYTMTFEQINHLWGALGGKQMPFVMYKARLVELEDRILIDSGHLIEEVNRNENAL